MNPKSAFYFAPATSYDAPVHQYFLDLWRDMNFRPVPLARYAGHASADNAITFSWTFIISKVHLHDKFYMYFFGGGVLLLPLFSLSLVLAYIEKKSKLIYYIKDGRLIFLLLALASSWYAFIRLIPMLGPTQDVDLFSNTYFLTAFVLGLGLNFPQRKHVFLRKAILALFFASSLFTFLHIMRGLTVVG